MNSINLFKNLPKKTNYFLITNLKNIRYLSGFSGEWAVILLSKKKQYFLTDSRFTEQALKETSGFEIITIIKPLTIYLKQLIGKSKNVAFEADNLRYSSFTAIRKKLAGRKFVPTSGIIEKQRMIKTQEEIKKISKAAIIADKSYSEILKSLKPGLKEIDIASEFEYILRKNGSEAHPFPTIAITSANTSLPHGQPGMRKIKKGDFFLLDFGATYKGYVSDMTRTVVIGKATQKQKKIYDIVLRAQMSAIKTVKLGMKLSAVDSSARNIIKEAGYGDNFGHGLGHGIGLEVHEAPGVSYRSKETVRAGMVFTIEPGIYIPKWGGVRIEDDIAIYDNKISILTKSPKEKLMEL